MTSASPSDSTTRLRSSTGSARLTNGYAAAGLEPDENGD